MQTTQALSFDSLAADYDRYRPSYPEDLIEDLFAALDSPRQARVLEIGCGSGIATVGIARRGVSLVCLEPGVELAKIARAKLADFKNCEVLPSKFEDWTVEPDRFDLVYSAQAFHWLNPETRFQQVASALAPNGLLAIFGNVTLGASGGVQEAIDAAYKRYAPGLAGPSPTTWYAPDGPIRGLLQDSRLFAEPDVRYYKWSTQYTTDGYLGLLRTHSDHSVLPTTTTDDLYGAIRASIETCGGRIQISYGSTLFVARHLTRR